MQLNTFSVISLSVKSLILTSLIFWTLNSLFDLPIYWHWITGVFMQVSWLYIYMSSYLNFGCPDLNVDPLTGNYYPIVYFNEFWLLRDKLIPLNETVTELSLNLEVGPISMTKWQLFLQIDQSFQIHRSYGSMLEGEADELKVCHFRNLSQFCIIIGLQ